jgi:hypothetical protein
MELAFSGEVVRLGWATESGASLAASATGLFRSFEPEKEVGKRERLTEKP